MVAFYTRRIEADPQDAYAYSSRARYYDYLHDRAKAECRHEAVFRRPEPGSVFGFLRSPRRGDSGALSTVHSDINSPSLLEGGTMGFKYYVLPLGRREGVK